MSSLKRFRNEAAVTYRVFKQSDKYYMDIDFVYADSTFLKTRNNIYDPESDEFAKVYILPLGEFVYLNTDEELLDLLRRERDK